jgi:mannose-6-phosphate isomerase-like protein (cupin superfamily)
MWENDVMKKVNLIEKFALFDEHWTPKIVGELNGQYVKLAKLEGEFVWHHHEAEDEMFLVVNGSLRMRLPEEEVVVGTGEFLIVPRGVEHCPVAEEEVHVLLFEPKSTAHTGNVRSEMAVEEMDWI